MLLPLASLCAACEQAPEASEPLVRDSLGITVVEYPAGPGSVDPFVLTAEPLVAVGAPEGPTERLFSRIVGAFMEPGGSLVVADGQALEIRWFDERDEHVRTVGGRGDGPGEFRDLSWVGSLAGDTIGAWDGEASRLSLFSGDGDFLFSLAVGPIEGSFSIPGAFLARNPRVLGAYGDGSLVAELRLFYPDPDPGVRRDSVPLMLYDRETGRWRRVGSTAGVEWIAFPASDVVSGFSLPFGVASRVAVSSDWAAVGGGDEAGLSILDDRGELQVRLIPNFRQERVEEDDIAFDRQERLRAAPEEARDEYGQVLSALPYPDHWPAHGDVVAGPEEIWVQVGSQSPLADTHRWLVFSNLGTLMGAAEVPADLRVAWVGAEHLVGVVEDELGVGRVVVFGVTRAGSE